MKISLLFTSLLLCSLPFLKAEKATNSNTPALASGPASSTNASASGLSTDAASFGFSSDASGLENSAALQKALDQTGTITISQPGIYKIATTVFIGSNTTLHCDNNVFLEKVEEKGKFTHVILNKGALTKTYDEHIAIEGLQIIVNGVDVRKFLVYGLHGQLAFFYVKDLRIEHFRCLDGGHAQYCIQACSFEDILINDVIIKGDKDGIHLGRGKRFTIRNGVFETGDDAIALNAHDYSVGNPELGWIEDGLIENCRDLANPNRPVGYFCRILAGAWLDWKKGMEVQQSDTVVSHGRLYRIQSMPKTATPSPTSHSAPDVPVCNSFTQPTFAEGYMVLDGIRWGVVQNDVTYTAGVRNVTFRDIFLEKPRLPFSIHFDNDKYSRSYYPGAEIPEQQNLVFDDIRILFKEKVDLMQIHTPVNVMTIINSSIGNNRIHFISNKAMSDYGKTTINMIGCSLINLGSMEILNNSITSKIINFKTTASAVLSEKFSALVNKGGGSITINSDLPGLLNPDKTTP